MKCLKTCLRKTPIGTIGVVAVALILVILPWRWAVLWYSESAWTMKKFTPGDLGSAMNIANVLVTCLLAFLAWKAYKVSQRQLRQLASDQQLQLLERSLSSALLDYQRRYVEAKQRKKIFGWDTNDPFDASFEASIYFEADLQEIKASRDFRFVSFRSSNYILRPLDSWCRLTERSRDVVGPEYGHFHEMNAARIIASLDSSCHIYLVMTHLMNLGKVVASDGTYVRNVKAHESVMQYLLKYAPDEVEEIWRGNQGQFKKLNEMLQRTGWHDNEDVRRAFFSHGA